MHLVPKETGPLHMAALDGLTACLSVLLRFLPDDDAVNYPDEQGRTALWLAARNGRPDCVELLLERDACVGWAVDPYAYRGHYVDPNPAAPDFEAMRPLLWCAAAQRNPPTPRS